MNGMSDSQDLNGGNAEEAELDGMAEAELGGILDDEDGQDEEDLDDDGSDGSDGEGARPQSIEESIERLDALLAETREEEKIRAGMGIRLALGMAQELKNGQPLGSETGDLVTEWLETYGQETVDAAVAIARQFLTKPEDMRKALGKRLGLEGED
jgi:hypothetical protein